MHLNKETIANLNAKYSAGSVKGYQCRYRRVCKLMGNVNKPKDLTRNKCKDVITALKRVDACSRSSVTYAILSVLQCASIDTPKELKQYAKEQKTEYKAENIKQRQAKKLNKDLNCPDVKQHFHDLLHMPIERFSSKQKNADGSPKQLQSQTPKWSTVRSCRCVLFQLLDAMPIRLTELSGMGYTDDQQNYIDLDAKQMVIRKQKVNSRGTRKIDLPDEAVDCLRVHRQKMHSDYIFPSQTDRNKPMQSASIEQLYRKAMKAYCQATEIEYKSGQCGIHSLRANKETENLNPLLKNTVSLEQMQEIMATCNKMGHSLETAILNYFRNE